MFVEQQQIAHHCDVSQGHSLPHKECACGQHCIQHPQHLSDHTLGLLCGLKGMHSGDATHVAHEHRRLTCLLYCMIPKVGKTHVQAAGRISLSAKLIYCWTRAAFRSVKPFSCPLDTGSRQEGVTLWRSAFC